MTSDETSALSRDAIKAHWQQSSSSLASVLATLEDHETWVFDTPHSLVDDELVKLGGSISLLSFSSFDDIEYEDMSVLLASVSFGRALRLQQIFTELKPDFLTSFSEFVEYTKDDPISNVNFARIRLLSQFNFLSAVFSKDRIDLVSAAMHEVLDDDY